MYTFTRIHVEYRPADAFLVVARGARAIILIAAFEYIEGTFEEREELHEEITPPGVGWVVTSRKDSHFFITFDHRGLPIVAQYLR